MSYRAAVEALIRREALPVDKYGHQPRLYAITQQVGRGQSYDDDVVFAAAWLHDLGVFIGHRPEDPAALTRWNHVAYAEEKVPVILRDAGFPEEKIPAVLDCIRTHQPGDEPATIEAVILRDADMLEQLGAIGILRAVCKIGRDTRFATFTPVVEVLRRALAELPPKLRLEHSRTLAAPKIAVLESFLAGVEAESQNALF